MRTLRHGLSGNDIIATIMLPETNLSSQIIDKY